METPNDSGQPNDFRLHHVHPRLLQFARDMRHVSAPAEQKLWQCLRDRRLCGLKFRRQKSVGPFIVDFYCAEHRLILELDGVSHDDRGGYDATRTRLLESRGYRVLRFRNGDVFDRLDGVLLAILDACGVDPNAFEIPSDD